MDVDGYLASIERCRARFPELRILSGIEAGEPHHFQGSVAAVLKQGRFDRVLGSLHSIVHDGRLVYTDRVFRYRPADAVVRDSFSELVRLVEAPAGTGRLAGWGSTAKPTMRRSTAPSSARWLAPTERSSSTPAARSRRQR